MARISPLLWDEFLNSRTHCLVMRRCRVSMPVRLTATSSFSSPSTSTSSSRTPCHQPRRTLHTTQPRRVVPSMPPSASPKLAALHSRIGLSPDFSIQTLARSLIDSTAESSRSRNNDGLSNLGNTLMGYYTGEMLMCKYPRLPTPVLLEATKSYCGPTSLAAIGKDWGVECAFEPGETVDPGLLQFQRIEKGHYWKPAKSGIGSGKPVPEEKLNKTSAWVSRSRSGGPDLKPQHTGIPQEHAIANFVRSVVAGVYLHEGGLVAAKKFVKDHILSRKVEISQMFQFKLPTRELSRLCTREGLQPPIARLLAETGRHSRHPVFVVGVFSGEDKLGEGQGGSLDEARIRAAISALKGWYLYSPPGGDKNLPSMTYEDPNADYKPTFIDVGEVVI